MSDRIPGSGPTNPIMYKGWAIHLDEPEEVDCWAASKIFFIKQTNHKQLVVINGPSEQVMKRMIDDLENMLNQWRAN